MNDHAWISVARRMGRFLAWHGVFALAVWCLAARVTRAQDAPSVDTDALAERAMAGPTDEAPQQSNVPVQAATSPKMPSMLEMFQRGGPFMWPILVLSFVVAIFSFERLLGLRRRKILPPKLVRQLQDLSDKPGGIDVKAVQKLCVQYPSPLANVLKAAVAKFGRPAADVEAACKDAADREANKLYGNVRPLNLAASVAPLLGLLGTLQGMIVVFYTTANLPPMANRVQALSDGIYMKLVTSFSGLLVAIPAVMLAHYFEGRIQRLFFRVDDVVGQVVPQLERQEAKPKPVGAEAEHRETKSSLRRPVEPLALPHAATKGE